jgi:hypothetical protein
VGDPHFRAVGVVLLSSVSGSQAMSPTAASTAAAGRTAGALALLVYGQSLPAPAADAATTAAVTATKTTLTTPSRLVRLLMLPLLLAPGGQLATSHDTDGIG